MSNRLSSLLSGYTQFRKKYIEHDESIMRYLAENGQNPKAMVIACSDSRVDPAIILQCNPGDLFIVRNVANIIPPYEKDSGYHGTSAALEFAIRCLKIKDVILLGHSNCGGIEHLLKTSGIQSDGKTQNESCGDDFITRWVSVIKNNNMSKLNSKKAQNINECAKFGLKQSYNNCLTFPWIKDALTKGDLFIHSWFFDIKSGEILSYHDESDDYKSLLDTGF